MGVTIRSKNYSFDMGYGGFNNFRLKVVKMYGGEFYDHAESIKDGSFLYGEERGKFFKKYDKKTKQMIEDKKVTPSLANFYYQCDCEGSIDSFQANEVYELIKDCDDDIIYGYCARPDRTTMGDLKKLFRDCKGEEEIRWH